MLVYRLQLYYNNCTDTYHGFIPDVVRILKKYNLEQHILSFMENGTFLSKHTWKCICKRAVSLYEETAWSARIAISDDCTRFRKIHTELKPSILWEAAKRHPNTLPYCSFTAKICVSTVHAVICDKCETACYDELRHLIFFCKDDKVQQIVQTYWTQTLIQFGPNLYNLLKTLSPDQFVICALGGYAEYLLDVLTQDIYVHFILCCSKFINKLYSA